MATTKRDIIRLVINLTIVTLIIFGGMFLFRSCFGKEEQGWELEEHPLKVENIRKIAEISTVSYKDELVVDSIEYYQELTEQVAGNISNLKDVSNWKYSIRGSAIKRRLTLIVGGEVRYGFNLKDERFKVESTQDSVIISLPEPKILDVVIVPSGTTIFQEHGEWNDNARIKMQNKAEKVFKKRSSQLDLENKSKMQVEVLLKKMMTDTRTLIIKYQ